MPKEWILNSATNRFQFNYSRNVGKVAEEIRKCQPRTLSDWEIYYYTNVHPKDHLVDLGKRLFVKISEVLQAELERITEADCIEFIITLVIGRTFDGYVREIKTIYGQLQEILDVKIEPAPDEWDRAYNVDFFIKVTDNAYIGIQIKPAGSPAQIPQIFKERDIQAKTHEKFTEKFGGKVFYIFSVKTADKKVISNIEVIDHLREEILRLKKTAS